MERVTAASGAESVHSPLPSASALLGVPTTVIPAPAIGSRVVPLVTLPVMGRCCPAAAPMPTPRNSASEINEMRCSTVRSSRPPESDDARVHAIRRRYVARDFRGPQGGVRTFGGEQRLLLSTVL